MSSVANFTSVPEGTLLYLNTFFLALKVLGPFWIVILLFGLMANIINIIVFLKARARDSVSVLLLSLAMSDFAFLAIVTPSAVTFFMRTYAPSHRWPINPFIFIELLYWPAFTAYDISTFIAVSLGVMRCACVAMPLKFKVLFTTSRTVKWVVLLVILAVALRLPVLMILSLAWREDPVTNTTVVYLKSVNRAAMTRVNDIMNRGVVIYVTYITMIACVIILTIKIYQTSKIRRTMKTTSSTDKSTSKKDDKGLSSKDLQVVKSVVLVCTIFITSQLLFLVSSSIRLFDANFDNDRSLQYLFALFSQLSRTCSYLNASVNIFVYFNFNSKYRNVFKSLFLNSKH